MASGSWLVLVIAASGFASELRVECEKTGWLRAELDGKTVMTGGLMCSGPQWQHATQRQAIDVERDEDGRIIGRFAMPEGNEGELAFEQAVRRGPVLTTIDYRAGFDRRNDIKQLVISLVFPARVFAGRGITFFPSEATIALPREASTLRSEQYGWAFAVELDGERVLLVQTQEPTMLRFADHRQWGGRSYGVDIRMVGEAKVPAGASTRRRISLRIVSAAKARRLASGRRRDFDRTRPSLLLDAGGRAWLRDRQRDYASLEFEAQGIHWAYSNQDDLVGHDVLDGDRREIVGMIPVRGLGGTALHLRQVTERREGGLSLGYAVRVPRKTRINAYQITLALRADEFLGEPIVLSEPAPTTTEAASAPAARTLPATQAAPTSQRTLTIPLEPPEDPNVGIYTARRLVVAPGHVHGLTLEIDPPMQVFVEDRRADDSQLISLKLLFCRAQKGTTIEAGTSHAVHLTLTPHRSHQIVLHDAAAAHRTDTSDWAPFTLPWDTAAVDLSFLNDAPAGRHGFLRAEGDRFVFADGAPARFWGTCFTAEQNLPPHPDAEVTARRLARYGVNMVRVHQADAAYAANNLFREGRAHNGTRRLDPAMVDRLDYLIAQLKANGIYVYFDLLSTRTFDASDGVASAAKLDLGGKPYTNFDAHLIALQKEFARQFLSHRNPYTGLAYKDDPAVAMIALVNENDLFTHEIEVEPYRSDFERRFRRWAAAHDVELPEGKLDLRHDTPASMRFRVEVQRDYNRHMTDYLRAIGVRAPITGSNWTRNAGLLASFGPVDFTDSHAYWDHCWDNYTRIRNRMMVRSRRTIFSRLAFQRMPGKPFFVSEWGQPWPNEFRAEMPLAVAAVTALQGWGGALIYTYDHASNPGVDCLSGPFDTLNDPCLFGLFYHAALLVRRPDARVADGRLAVEIPEEKIYAKKPANPGRCSAFDVSAERSVVASALGGDVPDGWKGVPCKPSILGPKTKAVTSDTGRYHRDWFKGVAWVDTPRTQAAWGFLGKLGEPVRLSDLELRVSTDFASVALSSLTDEPIARSDRLLLTAVSRAENTGMVYDLFHTRRIAEGHGPILIEPVRATVVIRTDRRDLRIRGLDPRGRTTVEVPMEQTDRLRFEIGPHARTMHYLIEK